MRLFFVGLLLLNILVLAMGAGYLGLPPALWVRGSAIQRPTEFSPQSLKLGNPTLVEPLVQPGRVAPTARKTELTPLTS